MLGRTLSSFGRCGGEELCPDVMASVIRSSWPRANKKKTLEIVPLLDVASL